MGIIVSLIVLFLYLFFQRKTVTKSYAFWSFLLVFYLSIALSEVVGFPSLPEFNRLAGLGQTFYRPEINWLPFSNGVDISSILNIFFFIPLGVALPVMWKRFQNIVPTFLVGFLMSLMIEVAQLFTIRLTDVNDLIMNTLGVVVGWLLAKYLFHWQVQRNDGRNLDWLVFLLIPIVSCFVLG